jgi:hypothetical protein
MSRKRQLPELRIWGYNQAPISLRRIAPATCEWVALIPRELVCQRIETFFKRWHTQLRPVSRYVLEDGSVLMAGDSRLFLDSDVSPSALTCAPRLM